MQTHDVKPDSLLYNAREVPLIMDSKLNDISRRSFLQRSSGAAAAATAFTIVKPELVRGAGKEKLKAGLIGCGGRGTQAVMNILDGSDNVEIVAMADVFEDRLEGSIRAITEKSPKAEQFQSASRWTPSTASSASMPTRS